MVEREFPKHVRDLGTSIHWKSVVKIPPSPIYHGGTRKDLETFIVGISKVYVPLQQGGRKRQTQF